MKNKKIDAKLKDRALECPEKAFNVIIVYDDNLSPEIFDRMDCRRLMQNIASCYITGQQIMELVKQEKIHFIEEDISISTL